MGTRLTGRRAVVTEADSFMGPAIVNLFRDEGAQVIEDRRDLSQRGEAERLITEARAIDILIVNLRAPGRRAPAHQTTDEDWDHVFRRIVTPTHRLIRAVLPQMLARRSGKIVVIGGAGPEYGTPNLSCHDAARGAQHAYVRSVGIEVARHNVQVNATGQGSAGQFGHLSAGGQVSSFSNTNAELVLFLCGAGSDFISGQVFANTEDMLNA